ncbi:hypothetical protein [Salegentibacter sediminis]|uniref:hypothetical protein n=1 Tax=Salegentibacter sediminis TaxID=1930251 RepID=UPI0009C085A8|nr:hypothetical protein [Salegentibacter sediminis]
MKRYLLFSLIVLFGINAHSQIYNQNLINDRMTIPVYKKTPEGFTGTPFVDEEFRKGAILDEEGNAQPAFLRYNAVEGIMEIKLNKLQEDIHVLPRIEKITYTIDGYTYFIDSKRTEDGELLKGYFVNYYDGDNVKLLGWPRPDVIEAQMAKTGYDKDKPAHLKVEMEYYLEIGDARLQEVRLRPRDFRKTFDEKDAMKKYLSDNKVKDLDDAIEALKFYDNQA